MNTLVIAWWNIKKNNNTIIQEFISLIRKKSLSDDIKVWIIPTGSEEPIITSLFYKDIFNSLEVFDVEIIPIIYCNNISTSIKESNWKNNAQSKTITSQILSCDGIWFVGWDQLRYTHTFYHKNKNTLALNAIYLKKNLVIGGTSAWASIMSEYMIYEHLGKLSIEKWFKLFPYWIIDQHFTERNRLTRLQNALTKTTYNYGFWIDEQTAIVLNNNILKVIWKWSVTLVEKNNLKIKKYFSWEIIEI